LRELLARQVLFPAVAAITDPDVVNARLLEWLSHRGGRLSSVGPVVDIGKEGCLHADSFEEFLGVINAARDAKELMHIRHSIINEIMQATTLETLRDAKGTMEPTSAATEDEAADAARKRNLLSPRHLKRYVSQLALARTACERRLRELDSHCDECDSTSGAHAFNVQGRKRAML
jgi:sorting nexin-25